MMQLVASATMEEAIEKLMPFIMPIWHAIQIGVGVGIASFILWFINDMIKSNAQKREKIININTLVNQTSLLNLD